jgi:hypothetical protein
MSSQHLLPGPVSILGETGSDVERYVRGEHNEE